METPHEAPNHNRADPCDQPLCAGPAWNADMDRLIIGPAVRNIEGDEMHPNTTKLMADFTSALADKLAAAEKKYGYADNWLTDDWEAECRQKLIAHIEKGDPLDVAAYCAFMWKRGWSTKRKQ